MEGNEESGLVVTVGDENARLVLLFGKRAGFLKECPDRTFLTRLGFDE